MASPMREKRAWPTREKDAEANETAAFEAAVAVVKETVVRSGEMLVSAKEDLSDHQRWLKAQSVAVEADRARHERWLQRQREAREALARRERARRKRQIMRQRAVRAVNQAVAAALLFVKSLILLMVARVVGGITYVLRSIDRADRWVWDRIVDFGLYLAELGLTAADWVVTQTGAFGVAVARADRWVWDRIVDFALLTAELGLTAVDWTLVQLGALDAAIGHAAWWAWDRLVDFALLMAELALVAADWVVTRARAFAFTSTLVGARAVDWFSSKTSQGAHVGGRSAVAGSKWIAAKTQALAHTSGQSVAAGSSWLSRKSNAFAHTSGKSLVLSSSWLARKGTVLAQTSRRRLAQGSSWAARKGAALAQSSGRSLAQGSSWLSRKGHAVASSRGESLSTSLSWLTHQGGAVAEASGKSLATGFALLSRKAAALGRTSGTACAAGYAWGQAKARKVAPTVYVLVAKAGRQAERYARAGAVEAERYAKAGAARAERMFESAKIARDTASADSPSARGSAADGAPVEGAGVEGIPAEAVSMGAAPAEGTAAENELSSSPQTGTVDVSKMLIIAGVVLMVCGGLLLGSGLMLRASTPPAPEEPHAITWLFEEQDRPLVERIVFMLSGTPEAPRIDGLSISAENRSDQPLTGVEGVIKTDVPRPDLKLAVRVERPDGGGDPEAPAAAPLPSDAVPPRAIFKLEFPFPAEALGGEEGLTPEEFFESYGGLMLNIHYELAGKQRALMQYVPKALLRAQLAEVQAMAGGS